MADQFFYEEGYIADDYFVYVADASATLSGAMTATMTAEIAITSGYYIPDYIETGYFAEGTTHEASANIATSANVAADVNINAVSTVTLNTSTSTSTDNERIRETNVTISGAMSASVSAVVNLVGDIGLISNVTMTTDADRIRDNDVTLSNIVNLSLQAAITSDSDSTLTTATTLTTTAAVTRTVDSSLVAVVAFNASPSAVAEVEADVNSEFTLSVTTLNVQQAQADLSSAFTQTANVIEYQLRVCTPKVPNYSDVFSYPTNNPNYFGTYIGYVREIRYDNVDELIPDNINEYIIEWWENYRTPENPFFNEYRFEIREDDDTPVYDEQTFLARWGTNYTNNTLTVGIDDTLGTFQSVSYTVDSDWDTTNGSAPGEGWNHIVYMFKPGSGFKLFVNGILKDTNNYTGNIRIPSNSVTREFVIGIHDSSELFFIDEVRVSKGTNAIADAGYNYNGSSFTLPTSGLSWEPGTQLLLHFENNLDDDVSGCIPARETFDVNANLISAYTLSADSGRLSDITTLNAGTFAISADVSVTRATDATLNGESIIVATTGFLKDAVPDLDAVASQISVINKIGDYLVDISMSATLNADAVEIVQLDSALASNTTQIVDAVVTTDVVIDLTTTTTVTTDGKRIRDNDSALDSSFTITADVVEIIQLASNLNSAFIQETNGIIGVEAGASLDTSIALTADNVRVRFFDAQFDAFAATLTSGSKIGDYLVDIPMSASLTVDANVKSGSVIGIDSATSISADLDRYRLADASLDSAFIQETNGIIGVEASVAVHSNTRVNADAVQIVDAQIAISGAMSFATTVKANRAGEIDIETSATLAVDAVVTRDSVIELNTVANLNAQQTTIRDVNATFNTSATVTANGRIITLLEELEYIIPSENRTFAIEIETREYQIKAETRTYTV